VLDHDRWILLRAESDYAARYEGQVAVLVAANLMARMTPSVAVDLPDVAIVDGLPYAGANLKEVVLASTKKTDPWGEFVSRPYRHGDYVLQLGRTGSDLVIHGAGWDAYVGPQPSPLPASSAPNPIGPAMAAILAISSAFTTNLASPPAAMMLNALNWKPTPSPADAPRVKPARDLGELWTVGVGSVGTATLYFLTLATVNFSACLADMDVVAIHNLDRSPMFFAEDVGLMKTQAAARYLREVGVSAVGGDPFALDQSEIWKKRQSGRPDILISAANERKVRSVIEAGYPPIQIYGTTGKNWQSSLLRHIPLQEACSCCVFPDEGFVPTGCATAKLVGSRQAEQVDAALPFLSFAAGAMAAAEILKLGLPGYPFTTNRITLNTRPSPWISHAPPTRREGCICHRRSPSIHSQMIAGSRYAGLS
jgi:hypothetical protein